jgi:hypothetical protein
VVYDLAMYPAASKTRGAEVFEPLARESGSASPVFVRYEYGAPEPDVEFDRNDISWCQVFIETTSGSLAKVFDDETC